MYTGILIIGVKYILYYEDEEDEIEDDQKSIEKDDSNNFKSTPLIKFEDKYLDKLKALEVKELSIEKLDGLSNSFTMENTILGNVIMYWDNKRETFAYYADHIIPYRFLEVIGRKYVITNDCKKIFVDMAEEIRTAEGKLEEKKRQIEVSKQEEQERRDNQGINYMNNMNNNENAILEKIPEKKNVFAKMKSYNTNSSIKAATVSLDSKKSGQVPKNTAVNTKPEEDKILKENSNRYSYQGRLANFSFLKKVERKVVDKAYALTFAEFKKLKV
jgi:hypothetical protein